MSKPIVVQICWMPEEITQRLADAGTIELRRWSADEEDKKEHTLSAPREWLLEHVRGAHALLCTPVCKVDEDIMEAAGSSLKVISTMSVGFEHIDVDAAKKRGIRIGYTPDVLSNAVADLSLVLCLNVMRHVMESYTVVKQGNWHNVPWTPMTYTGPALEGKVVGFIGFGSIAQALVRKLMAFRPAQILYRTSSSRPFDWHDKYFRHLAQDDLLQCYYQQHQRLPVPVDNEPDLQALAQKCDVIFIIANLTPSTKHMINTSFLQTMKKSAYLINVGRGPIIDTEALVEALRENWIAGAGLDVVEGEPFVSKGHPLLAPDMLDKVMLLSHIASATIESRRGMAKWTAQNAFGALGLRDDGPPEEMPSELKF